MVLWGGVFDSTGGRYSPTSNTWRRTSRINAPTPPLGGRWSTVWTGSQMIVWGGASPTQKGALYCASGTANAAPVAASDAYSAAFDKITLIGADRGTLSNDSDANQDLLTAQALTKPAHGALIFNSNGSFLYKPVAGFTGTDSFTYHAYDGVAFSNPATVTIAVH